MNALVAQFLHKLDNSTEERFTLRSVIDNSNKRDYYTYVHIIDNKLDGCKYMVSECDYCLGGIERVKILHDSYAYAANYIDLKRMLGEQIDNELIYAIPNVTKKPITKYCYTLLYGNITEDTLTLMSNINIIRQIAKKEPISSLDLTQFTSITLLYKNAFSGMPMVSLSQYKIKNVHVVINGVIKSHAACFCKAVHKFVLQLYMSDGLIPVLDDSQNALLDNIDTTYDEHIRSFMYRHGRIMDMME